MKDFGAQITNGQLAENWDVAETEALLELCHLARVSELLANLPWRQISSGFQKRLQEAWEKRPQ